MVNTSNRAQKAADAAGVGRRRTLRRRIGRFWSSDVGLTALLVALILIVFFLRPLVDLGLAGGRVVEMMFVLVMLSAAWSVWGGRWRMTVIGLGVGITGALRWLHWADVSPRIAPWAALASAVMIGLFLALVLRRVFQSGPVTWHRIQGAVAVYLLFGLAWAQVYEGVEALAPGAFQLPRGDLAAAGWFSPLLYFSFITLTTLGYGDILPVHPAARSLAMFEALMGQLYPAILIAKLVSLQVTAEMTAGGHGGAGPEG
jgi:ion channel